MKLSVKVSFRDKILEAVIPSGSLVQAPDGWVLPKVGAQVNVLFPRMSEIAELRSYPVNGDLPITSGFLVRTTLVGTITNVEEVADTAVLTPDTVQTIPQVIPPGGPCLACQSGIQPLSLSVNVSLT